MDRVGEEGVTTMQFDRRDIFEDVASTILATATVMGFTATHQYWDVWLIGDSRRRMAGLLTVIAVAMFALSPLSLLAATIILTWALAVLRDLFEVPRSPLLTH
jgi:hypothetical protein